MIQLYNPSRSIISWLRVERACALTNGRVEVDMSDPWMVIGIRRAAISFW